MTRDDTICLINTLDRLRPAYAEWRSEQANKLARAHGTTPTEEARAMVDSFARSVAQVTTEEAAAVVDGLESGAVELPFWGEMAATVRREAYIDRQGRREAEKYQREGERRFHCIDCLDAGYVAAYWPKFVEWLRPRFEAWQADREFPKGWYQAARSEWNRLVVRHEQKHPAEVTLVCRCNCPNAVIYRKQLARLRDYNANPQGKPVRAAHIGQWEPTKVCRVTFSPEADLIAWYDAHDANENYEWTPPPGEYAERFN